MKILTLEMKTRLYGVQYAFDMEFGTTLDPIMMRCEIKTFNRAERKKMKN
jgi:hypothetical protein